MNRPRVSIDLQLRVSPTEVEIEALFSFECLPFITRARVLRVTGGSAPATTSRADLDAA